jgi:hypothetical protein
MRGKNLVVGGKVSIAWQKGWTKADNEGEANEMSAPLKANITWSEVPIPPQRNSACIRILFELGHDMTKKLE